jgi:hypothetical protein
VTEQAGTVPDANASPAALAAIVALTELMLKTAREGDWLALLEQETRRRPLLADVFAAPQAFLPHAVNAMITEVLRLDREIAALGEAGRRDIAAQLHALTHGQRAQRAYGQTAGG